MGIAIRFQVRVIALALVAVSIMRPIGFFRASRVFGDGSATGSMAPDVLMMSYEFVLAALCAWGLLKLRPWGRWIAVVLTSRLAMSKITSFPLILETEPLDAMPAWEWLQWGTMAAAGLFTYFACLLLTPAVSRLFDEYR